jgi:hypothetical protein
MWLNATLILRLRQALRTRPLVRRSGYVWLSTATGVSKSLFPTLILSFIPLQNLGRSAPQIKINLLSGLIVKNQNAVPISIG